MINQSVLPSTLSGPRSYFTDLDPLDQSYNQTDVIRKLKLQLLTKENIVIAASSLFHEIGFNLFSSDIGLSKALQDGIILPAIRDEFYTINDFFVAKSRDGYTNNSASYFSDNTKKFVHWNLLENSNWFQEVFLKNVQDHSSLFRTRVCLSQVEIDDYVEKIKQKIREKPTNQQHLSRDDIFSVSSAFSPSVHLYSINFSNLIYRLSGAKVVNSEGHFPQSNLINLDIAGNDSLLTDFKIFWDLYIEAVFTSLSKAARLTPERIDSLEFIDILKIREKLFDLSFMKVYDELLQAAKSEASIHDPDKFIMKQEEILEISGRLREKLEERLIGEFGVKKDKMGVMVQYGSTIELITGGVIVGTLSAINSIPEMTAPLNPKLAESMQSKYNYMKRKAKELTGWNPQQKKALITGYKEILTYGFEI